MKNSFLNWFFFCFVANFQAANSRWGFARSWFTAAGVWWWSRTPIMHVSCCCCCCCCSLYRECRRWIQQLIQSVAAGRDERNGIFLFFFQFFFLVHFFLSLLLPSSSYLFLLAWFSRLSFVSFVSDGRLVVVVDELVRKRVDGVEHTC